MVALIFWTCLDDEKIQCSHLESVVPEQQHRLGNGYKTVWVLATSTEAKIQRVETRGIEQKPLPRMITMM